MKHSRASRVGRRHPTLATDGQQPAHGGVRLAAKLHMTMLRCVTTTGDEEEVVGDEVNVMDLMVMVRERVWGLKSGNGHCKAHGKTPELCRSTPQLSSVGP